MSYEIIVEIYTAEDASLTLDTQKAYLYLSNVCFNLTQEENNMVIQNN